MTETLLFLNEINPLILQMSPAFEMTDEQFFEFCQLNRKYRIERTTKGELIIMSPTGLETGNRNLKLTQQLANWTDKDESGIAFDSSTGFKLPNGAERSPDAAWMTLLKWNAIPPEQQARFAPVCPDFVVEMRSPSDSLKPLQEKMQEYLDNGALLGWLIDRKNRQVYIYRPNKYLDINKALCMKQCIFRLTLTHCPFPLPLSPISQLTLFLSTYLQKFNV